MGTIYLPPALDGHRSRPYIWNVYHHSRVFMRLNIHSIAIAAMAAIAGTALTSGAAAQTPVPASPVGPAVGSVAPDFSLPGATRYGLLKGPVHLADHRGETVVLAFFYQARTKG